MPKLPALLPTPALVVAALFVTSMTGCTTNASPQKDAGAQQTPTAPFALTIPPSCNKAGLPQTGLREANVRLHTDVEHDIAVELAITPQQRQTGMMCRTKMAPDTGMLFLFARERRQSFWMKNTLIPLDMVFIDKDGLVVGIVETAKPLDLRSRGVRARSQFVLELKGGEAARRGLRPGHRVEFLFDLALVPSR